MKKRMKDLRLMAGISATLAMLVLLLAVPPIVHGGGRWSGIDPVLLYGGHIVNVYVEWPEEHTCSISSPITMGVKAPGATLLLDSAWTFTCVSGDTNTVQTATTVLNSGKKGTLQVVNVMVNASQSFPVHVLVFVDGSLKQSCSGSSNKSFNCTTLRVF
jgi:hypothetical protein